MNYILGDKEIFNEVLDGDNTGDHGNTTDEV